MVTAATEIIARENLFPHVWRSLAPLLKKAVQSTAELFMPAEETTKKAGTASKCGTISDRSKLPASIDEYAIQYSKMPKTNEHTGMSIRPSRELDKIKADADGITREAPIHFMALSGDT